MKEVETYLPGLMLDDVHAPLLQLGDVLMIWM
jgi:hypothetical protein